MNDENYSIIDQLKNEELNLGNRNKKVDDSKKNITDKKEEEIIDENVEDITKSIQDKYLPNPNINDKVNIDNEKVEYDTDYKEGLKEEDIDISVLKEDKKQDFDLKIESKKIESASLDIIASQSVQESKLIGLGFMNNKPYIVFSEKTAPYNNEIDSLNIKLEKEEMISNFLGEYSPSNMINSSAIKKVKTLDNKISVLFEDMYIPILFINDNLKIENCVDVFERGEDFSLNNDYLVSNSDDKVYIHRNNKRKWVGIGTTKSTMINYLQKETVNSVAIKDNKLLVGAGKNLEVYNIIEGNIFSGDKRTSIVFEKIMDIQREGIVYNIDFNDDFYVISENNAITLFDSDLKPVYTVKEKRRITNLSMDKDHILTVNRDNALNLYKINKK